MSYPDFTSRFRETRIQHNIMALVGNGFDIQALSGLDAPTDTRYESFYHYLKYRRFDASNRILERMESLRGVVENWSDIESAINDLLRLDRVKPEIIAADLKEVQREFSRFLDQVATPEILARLGERAVAGSLTMTTFTEFLGDIDAGDEYDKMRLPKRINIGDLFNFKFINFNYTSLLDDFVYLDQDQFDPHPHKWSDRNLQFHPNPNGHDGGERASFYMESYLVADVVHPHGIQSTPRSLLFGIDDVTDRRANALSKPYWAQNSVKYGSLFPETHLFIVFGCSLGQTDRWWWRAIIEGLQSNDDADLIIYWRTPSAGNRLTAADLREKFAVAAGYANDRDVRRKLKEKCRVVFYSDTSERAWLNTNATAPPSWARP